MSYNPFLNISTDDVLTPFLSAGLAVGLFLLLTELFWVYFPLILSCLLKELLVNLKLILNKDEIEVGIRQIEAKSSLSTHDCRKPGVL